MVSSPSLPGLQFPSTNSRMKFTPLAIVLGMSALMFAGCASQSSSDQAAKTKRDRSREMTSAPVGSHLKRKSDTNQGKKASKEEFDQMKAEQLAIQTAEQQRNQ